MRKYIICTTRTLKKSNKFTELLSLQLLQSTCHNKSQIQRKLSCTCLGIHTQGLCQGGARGCF